MLAAEFGARIRREPGGRELYAVPHSLGGILVWHMGEVPFRRVVMRAPPNRGSQLALRLGGLRAFRWAYGPVGAELGRPEEWPAPTAPFAVIAGTCAGSPGNPTSWLTRPLRLLRGPNDGTVAVEETRHPGMVGFRTVEASHTSIVDHPPVRDRVLRFLETGSFG